MWILSSFNCVHTIVWLHCVDFKKHQEKMLDGNYRRMLHVVLNKSLQQHQSKQQMYCYLPPISQTIQIRWARHAGHCWGSKDINKQHSPKESSTWTHQCELTSKNLHSSTLCRHWIPSRGPVMSDGQYGQMVRGSQGNLCSQHVLMIMIYIYIYICVCVCI